MLVTLSSWPRRRRPSTTGSRTAPKPFVTDSQWNLIKHLFENPDPSPAGGRPRVEPRACLEGVIFVLRTGCQWQFLPDRYPSSTTCWRRFRQWTESGVLQEAWTILLQRMDRRGLLYDKAADADWLRDSLGSRGIELICPHRRGRTKKAKQDGRSLRRYRHRWMIERTISWLQNFRRLLVRHEYDSHLFNGLVTLACMLLVPKRF